MEVTSLSDALGRGSRKRCYGPLKRDNVPSCRVFRSLRDRSVSLAPRTDPDYVQRNIRNRLATQVVKDGSDTIVGRTDIVYDEYQQEPLVCVTGAPQHDDTNYGCSFEVRGNPTHVKRYLDLPGICGRKQPRLGPDHESQVQAYSQMLG